jgi:hypothetical protein
METTGISENPEIELHREMIVKWEMHSEMIIKDMEDSKRGLTTDHKEMMIGDLRITTVFLAVKSRRLDRKHKAKQTNLTMHATRTIYIEVLDAIGAKGRKMMGDPENQLTESRVITFV